MPTSSSHNDLKYRIKHLEKELARKDKELSDLKRFVDRSLDVIYQFDIKSKTFSLYNQAGYDLYGADDGKVPSSKTVLLSIHPEDRKKVKKAAVDSLAADRNGGEVEYRQQHADGSIRWMSDRWRVIRDELGKPLFLEGIVRDETERKNAEMKLRKQEEELSQIFSMSLDLICIADINTTYFLKVNPAFTETLGFAEKEFTGKSFLDFVHPDDVDLTKQIVKERLLKGVSVIDFENRYMCKNGSYRWLSWVSHPNPEKGMTFAVARDVTEKKSADQRNKKLQNQLIQAQRMESIGRLAGGVAHDFNNMLSIIIGNAEIILEDLEPENPSVPHIQEIHKAAKRSSNLTKQLLAFARKQTIAPEILHVNQTLEAMLNMLKRLIGENIELIWIPGENLWPIKMDPSQIDQILVNLCINARDSMKDIGKITIETANITTDEDYCFDHAGFKPGDYVVTAVSDNGCGMDEETTKSLFEPFFTTKDVGQGSGLGLATVYGIVKQNSGFIYVYSEIKKGTTFKIYFPRYVEETAGRQKNNRKTAMVGGRETILLVEDEKAILRMTAMMLTRLGYKVLTASSPEEALQLAMNNTGQIHMLMTDVIMPNMSGRDLAHQLNQLYPDMKCLFMSGYTANVIAHHGVLDEGVQFIAKPFSKQELAAKVRNVLDPKKAH